MNELKIRNTMKFHTTIEEDDHDYEEFPKRVEKIKKALIEGLNETDLINLVMETFQTDIDDANELILLHNWHASK